MKQKTVKGSGSSVDRNLGITMTTVLEILTQANRPLDKAYAKDIFNVRTYMSIQQRGNCFMKIREQKMS